MNHIDIIRAMLPHVDAARRVSGGDGDIAAMNARAAIAERDAMSADERLLMDLATPAGMEDALTFLAHPLDRATHFCEAREKMEPARAEFWHRLAGSIRKARSMV